MTEKRTTLGGSPVTIYNGQHEVQLGGVLGLDVESTYMTDRGQFDPDFKVRTVQLATEEAAWVFDLAVPSDREAVERVLADPEQTFCSHTNMDVLSVWVEFGIDISDRNLDTRMLATMADYDKRAKHDLKTLTTRHVGPELADAADTLDAWFREAWVSAGGKRNAAKALVDAAGWNGLAAGDAHEWPAVFTEYAGLDAIACRRLLPMLIAGSGSPPELLNVDQWLAARANRIQARGLRVDTQEVARLLEVTAEVLAAVRAVVERYAGLSPASPALHGWFSGHGVDWDAWPGATTPAGAPSLAKGNLALVGDYPLDEVGREVFDECVKFRAAQDLHTKTKGISARVVDGRIHPLLNTVGAASTARMSSSGPNMQNMSKSDPVMRGMFLPDPRHDLWTIDFDQVELRVVAALAREDKMIDVILAGGDLHQLTVDELAALGVTITRQQAKVANFLIVYGGGGGALHAQTGIPLDMANDVVKGIRERYPAIAALSAYTSEMRDEVRTISNRRLPVAEGRSYASLNYLIQSSARELLVEAWWRFEQYLGHEGVVWWPVHDELVLHVPNGDPAEEARIIADAERAMTMDFRGVPITATAVRLLDEHGVSRWMPADNAERIAREKVSM